MMNDLLPDELWRMIEPLLPKPKRRRRRFPGRRPIDDRKVMTALIFILKTGLPWHMLPKEFGCGCGRTVRRRLERWIKAGVFETLHVLLLQRLHVEGLLDCRRVIVDAGHVKAPKGGEGVGRSPVDRGKQGSKHHVMTDAHDAPLSVITTAGNRHDVTQLLPLVDSFRPIRGRVGRPRLHPTWVQGDEGYASKRHKKALRERHIRSLIAERGRAHGSGLGKTRWPVERTISWLHQKLKIGLRRDRLLRIHTGFVTMACAMICFQMLNSHFVT